MLNPLIRREPGTPVRYHGSLADLHGVYAAHPCDCLNCDNPNYGAVRYRLVDADGMTAAYCVRPASITPHDKDDRDDYSAHEECLGIHNSADGYRDCDGNAI